MFFLNFSVLYSNIKGISTSIKYYRFFESCDFITYKYIDIAVWKEKKEMTRLWKSLGIFLVT